MVVDLSGVGFAGSAALGNFVAFQRLVRSKGGRIVFCEVDPDSHRGVSGEQARFTVRVRGRSSGGDPRHQRAAAGCRPTEKRPPATSAPANPRRPGRSGSGPFRRRPSSGPNQRRHSDQINRFFDRESNPSLAGSRVMAVTPRIQVNEADGVKVVRFKTISFSTNGLCARPAIRSPRPCPMTARPIRLVVDFSDVGLISSTFLSKLILLQRRIDQTRGKLRLCEMSPIIQQVFRTSNLDRLFKIDRDQRTAIESFQ